MRHAIPLGKVVVTPCAREELAQNDQDPMWYVCRHARGEWGSALTPDEMEANDVAVEHGGRLLSAYYYRRWEPVWVITEADRSRTTVLLPEEY